VVLSFSPDFRIGSYHVNDTFSPRGPAGPLMITVAIGRGLRPATVDGVTFSDTIDSVEVDGDVFF